jgi:hypothetical protein
LIVATARAKPHIFAERGSPERSVLSIQVRMSSDRPILNAFCRVAPSVRFSLLAIRDAPFFWRAIVLKVRTCSAVHALRFLAFLAIEQLPVSKKNSFIAASPDEQKLKANVGVQPVEMRFICI